MLGCLVTEMNCDYRNARPLLRERIMRLRCFWMESMDHHGNERTGKEICMNTCRTFLFMLEKSAIPR